MTPNISLLLQKKEFSDEELKVLLCLTNPEDCNALYQEAFRRTTAVHGNALFWRGLIEISNVCVYDCRYCGIRKHNANVSRYTLSQSEILSAVRYSLNAGYGSVALQSGERDDPKFIAFIADTLRAIHKESVSMGIPSGCGITLSFGEQSYDTYCLWADAAGNKTALRYLLRLETTNPTIFRHIHGEGRRRKTLIERYMALSDLRLAGYQVGTGVMIGLPGQTTDDLVADIRTFQKLDVDMLGMGPYLVSQGGTLVNEGMMEKNALMTLSRNMLATTRLVLPNVNIAAATALETLCPNGRSLGVLCGCNVMMPNVTPQNVRANYQLYDNKKGTENEPDANVQLEKQIEQQTGRTVARNRFGSSLHFRLRNHFAED